MRRVSFIVMFVIPLLARGQAPSAPSRARGVAGVVYDSLAGHPLADAVVQLVATNPASGVARSMQSDSLGRFIFEDVPDGRYMLGFIHPVLDSLGLDPLVRDVSVAGPHQIHVDLAVPSSTQLRRAICGQSSDTSGGVFVGFVRNAQDASATAGDTVVARWLEITFTDHGLVRRTPRLTATTAANGWFAMCNVPRGGTMMLVANRGRDSTDLLDVDVPADGFLRRDLYVGPSRPALVRDSSRRGDSIVASPRRHEGDGQLSGTVVTAVGGRPLEGARVGLADGPETRADARGEWTLAHAPLGTRVLEVKAVGYFPARRVVDVVGQGGGSGSGAMPPMRVALSTLEAVLDTVRVTAARVFDRNQNEFEARRRRSATGRFITAADIARRNPLYVSDLLRMTPGVHVEYDPVQFGKTIKMRGAFGECSPAVFIDGMYVPSFDAEDIDTWVKPERVVGIEIYIDPPPDYQRALSGCGSIVIWSK